MPGKIELQRGHRYVAMFNGVKVRSGPRILSGTRRTDPVKQPAPGVVRLYHRLGAMAIAEARRLKSAQLGPAHIGHIDIQGRVRRQRRIFELLQQHANRLPGRIEPARILADQGNGNRRKTQEAAFRRRGHRARIQHVVAEIGAMVDAGDDHIRILIEQSGQGQVYAIGRRAVHAINTVSRPVDAQRRIQSQRMTRAALIAIRRDNDDVGEVRKRQRQRGEAIGLVAIIVTKQYSHLEASAGMMGRKKDKHSNSDETALFRESIGDVKPVPNRRLRVEPPAPQPHARFTRADDKAVLDESMRAGPDVADMETGEELVFHRPHVGRKVMRQLRRGNYVVQEEIDLHGMTADQAHTELHAFIKECSTAGLKSVRVVHGKGRGSGPKGPVLKAGVNRWLTRWQEVAAFCSAQPRDGGTGALYVLLTR